MAYCLGRCSSDIILGAVVDSKKGTPVDIKGFTTWGHAKGAFKDWAKLLKKSLEYEAKK